MVEVCPFAASVRIIIVLHRQHAVTFLTVLIVFDTWPVQLIYSEH